MIKDGSRVKLDYTLTVEGKVVDTSEGKKPLEYVQGQGQIISGLEKQVKEMAAGEEKRITIACAEAYGDVDPNAFKEIEKGKFPENLELFVGKVVPVQDGQGRQFTTTIHEIRDENVVLNLNHPLAGKDLQFDVKLVSVE
jgi:peptidylprolyl isomerase